MASAEIPEERANEDTFSYGRMSHEQWQETASASEASPRDNCEGLCRSLKLKCSRCCVFSCNNSKQLISAICFVYIFFIGIFKVVFASVAIVNGQVAIILAKHDDLHWCGVFLLVVGLSSIICGVAALYSIIWKRWSTLTAKQLYAVIFGMLYIVLFDVIAVIMVSKYTEEAFPSSIQANLQLSLNDKYGVSSEDYQEYWDRLQTTGKCCGASSYLEWFQSAWADEINSTAPSSVHALPISCRYENLPHGPCIAISGVPQQLPITYLLLDQYSIAFTCDIVAQSQGRLDYIYYQSCAQVYISQLAEEMRATMVIAITITATDFLIIIALASVAVKLPFRRRVHVYNAQPS